MVFIVTEHYNDDDNIKINENSFNECIICLDKINMINNEISVNFNTINRYIKFCNCNFFVHNYCLNIWCDKNLKCPICKLSLERNNFIFFFNTNNKFCKFIMIINKNNFFLFFGFLFRFTMYYFSICYFIYFLLILLLTSVEKYVMSV